MTTSSMGRTLLALSALTWAGGAWSAEAIGVLSVGKPPGPSGDLIEITGQLRKALAERTTAVVSGGKLRETMLGRPSGATLGELRRAYESSVQGALAAGDTDGALRTLMAIQGDLDKLPPSDEAFTLWTKVMLTLAKVESDLGHADAFVEVVNQIVKRAPDVQLSTREYPRRFVEQVEAAKAAQKGVPKVKLVVTSTTAGAKLFVDGRSVATAPVTLSLPVGTYSVVGQSGTVRTPPRTVSLAAEEVSILLDFGVPESLRPDAGPGLALADDAIPRGVLGAGAFLGLEKVVTVKIVTEEDTRSVSAVLYDVRRGAMERQGRVRLSRGALSTQGATALADFLLTGGSGSDLVEVPGAIKVPAVASAATAGAAAATAGAQATVPDLKAAPPAPPGAVQVAVSKSAEPPSTTALGWTAFGTGIATVGLATVAVIEGLQSNSDYTSASGYIAQGQWSQAQSANQSGDSARSVAMATGIGAAITGATTVVLGIVTGEIGPIRF